MGATEHPPGSCLQQGSVLWTGRFSTYAVFVVTYSAAVKRCCGGWHASCPGSVHRRTADLDRATRRLWKLSWRFGCATGRRPPIGDTFLQGDTVGRVAQLPKGCRRRVRCGRPPTSCAECERGRITDGASFLSPSDKCGTDRVVSDVRALLSRRLPVSHFRERGVT